MASASIRDKYLSRYATPEVALAAPLQGRWSSVLVVPACAESIDCLRGFTAAASSEDGRVLVILVVNAADNATEETHRTNAHMLTQLAHAYPAVQQFGETAATLHDAQAFDLLCIDRAGKSRRLPPKHGVGLARRIGCDVALALRHSGRLGSAWLHTTDADVTLPPDYFRRAEVHAPGDAVALTHRFRHEPGDLSAPEAHALALYEISLRYYVVGLSAAGSPFAYHAIGSTMSIDADAYAAVRGMPTRQAGEDFYALNKLAKLGPIISPPGAPLHISGRLSDRVPFGTGPATRRIASELRAGGEMRLYHPRTFTLLGVWLQAMNRFARTRRWPDAHDHLSAHPDSAPLTEALAGLGAEEAIRDAAHRCKTAAALARRCHEWMDAFRTLKLVHGMRDAGLSMLPWRAAVAAAPFALSGDASPSQVCDALARREPTAAGNTGG